MSHLVCVPEPPSPCTKNSKSVPTKPIKKRNTACTTRTPSYLYKRGNILYFRFVFNAEDQKRINSTEIRLSLQTGFLQEARKQARFLRAYLDELLMDKDLQLSDLKANLTEAIREKRGKRLAGATGVGEYAFLSSESVNLTEIFAAKKMQLITNYLEKNDRESTIADLEALLDALPYKQPPSIEGIRQKMNELLRRVINTLDACCYNFPSKTEDGQPMREPPRVGLSKYFTIHKTVSNNPEDLYKNLYPDLILELLQEGIFDLHELTKTSISQIINEYSKIQISLNRIINERENGNYGFEKQFICEDQEFVRKHATSEVDIQKHRLSQSLEESKTSLLLSEFLEKYKAIKIKDNNWTKKDVVTLMGRLTPLLKILGDIPVSSITREDMRVFRDKLRRLPPHRTKKNEYKGKTVDEILAMNPQEMLSISTVNDSIIAVSTMFKWGIREELLVKNPAEGLTLKDDRQEVDLRMALTADDLKIVFFSGDYLPSAFKYPAYYWAPVIALYSGMRREEICQLYISDIYQEDDLWLFDIRETTVDGASDKHLKTKNACRKIPIHDKLIELGLLDYWKATKGQKNDRLFPELTKTSEKYGDQVGKRFKYLLKKKLPNAEKKSFHSLRHTFSDFFKVKNLQIPIFTQLFGHEQKALATRQYGSKFSVKQCYDEIISKLHYDGEDNLQKENH